MLKLAVLVCLATVASAAPLRLFVSPNGNDAWTGTKPDPAGNDGPFATLTQAQQVLRAAIVDGRAKDGLSLELRAGTYVLTAPLRLGPEDSGTAAGPVVIKGYRNERPRVTGSVAITRFEPAAGGVLTASLQGTPLQGVNFRQLFCGSQRLELARYPNVDPNDPHYGTWAYVLSANKGARTEFRATDDVIKDWTRVDRAEIAIHPSYGWAWAVLPLKSVDRKRGLLTLGKSTPYDLMVGDRYFVRGLKEELDAPGEWHLDPDTSQLSVIPPEGVKFEDVRAPVTKSLFELTGAKYLTLHGLLLDNCDGDAVALKDSEQCRVSGCVIRNTGGWAVTINGGSNCAASGCDLSFTGAGGVTLSGGEQKTLAPAGHVAENNYIHHIGEFRRTYNTGVNLRGVGNIARRNLIHDCPHQAILIGGNDQLVEGNILHHTNLGSEDTGAIYMSSRDYSQRGTIIRHNVIHHVGGFGKASSWTPVADGKVKFEYPHFTWGIYLDAPEVGVTVYGNVLYSVPVCGMFNHSGKDNTWENNIIVDAPAFRASIWGRDDLSVTSWKGLERAKEGGYFGTLLEHYPELKRYDPDEPRRTTMFNCKFVRNLCYYTEDGGQWLREQNAGPWGNGQLVFTYRGHQDDYREFTFDHNLVYAAPGIEPKFDLTLLPNAHQLLDWDGWRATGQDEHSVMADPLFVDPEHHDYRLQPDSPALKLGFKPIPFDQIGPYESPDRASWPVVEAPGASALGDFHTERYFELPGAEPMPAAELIPRLGLGRTWAKLQAGQPVTIACFAGGNHQQGGWFEAFARELAKQYPKSEVTAIPASIHGGARGSMMSIYRFGYEVLRHDPDLIFIDFAADDKETTAEQTTRTMEGAVRQALQRDPTTDLCFVYSFRVGYEQQYDQGVCPSPASAMERVAEHYGLPSINFGARLAALIRDGQWLLKATADEAKAAGKPAFSHDGTYTSPDANTLDAAMAAELFGQLPSSAVAELVKARQASMTDPVDPDNYQRATEFPITQAMLTGKWESTDPVGFAQHFPELWVTTEPGAKLTFKFKGTDCSLFDLMGPTSGVVQVTVDGKVVGNRQQVDRWCYYDRISQMTLAQGLEDAEHTVIVELLPDPPDRSGPMAEAKKLGRYQEGMFEGVSVKVGMVRVMGEGVE